MTDLIDRLESAEHVVDDLLAAIEAELSSVPGQDIDAAVTKATGLSDRFDAAVTQITGEWNGRGLFRLDGSKSAPARLARDAGWSKPHASITLRRAKTLRQFALVREAYVGGEISTDKVDVLARAATAPRHELFAEAEARLVSDAKRLSHGDLVKAARYWCDAADDHLNRPPRAGKDAEGRGFNASPTFGGSRRLDGLLDPIGGSIFGDELDRLTQELFEEDWAIATQKYGDAVTIDLLPRTPAQRRADALVLMATRSATLKDGQAPRPLFTVLVGRQAFDRTCELANGTVITPDHLKSWLALADIERAVFDGKSRIIDIGTRTRFFRGGLRRAIEIRDRHCTFPGCDIPANRCDIDHIIEYVDGGPTTQTNGRLRCPTHNRQRPGRTTPPRAGP